MIGRFDIYSVMAMSKAASYVIGLTVACIIAYCIGYSIPWLDFGGDPDYGEQYVFDRLSDKDGPTRPIIIFEDDSSAERDVSSSEQPVREELDPEPDAVSEDYGYFEEPVYEEYISYYADTEDPATVSSIEGQLTPVQFKSMGVLDTEEARYTWYSENVLPGGGLTELNANGRTVNEDGFVTDGDGYIAVASGSLEKGTVVQTPFGEVKVYDECETPGVIDIYVSW